MHGSLTRDLIVLLIRSQPCLLACEVNLMLDSWPGLGPKIYRRSQSYSHNLKLLWPGQEALNCKSNGDVMA